jgi:hypothetical protein
MSRLRRGPGAPPPIRRRKPDRDRARDPVNPSDDALARIGAIMAADRSAYDPVISGGASAGLAAAIHAARPIPRGNAVAR